MIVGQPTRLASRFRLTYNMILSLFRVESIRIEEMIRRSFGENAVQKAMPVERARLEQLEVEFANVDEVDCVLCNQTVEHLYEASRRLARLSSEVFEAIFELGKASRYFEAGRVILVAPRGQKSSCAALVKGINSDRTIRCIANVPLRDAFVPFGHASRDLGKKLETMDISPADVLFVPLRRATESDYFWEDVEAEEAPLPLTGVLDVDEKLLKRKDFWKHFRATPASNCPDRLEHYDLFARRALLANEIAELKFRLSDFGLALLPEYHQRVEVLKTLGYVDANCVVSLKGRVACEINTANELITTELIFANAFRDMEPADLPALMSTMVYQEKERAEEATDEEDVFLEGPLERLHEIACNLASVQRQAGLPDISRESTLASLNPSLMRVVHAWARHAPFIDICRMTDVLEGSIVRCIVRLGETMRELRSAGKLLGDPSLVQKAEQAAEGMRRDICFAASLYYK